MDSPQGFHKTATGLQDYRIPGFRDSGNPGFQREKNPGIPRKSKGFLGFPVQSITSSLHLYYLSMQLCSSMQKSRIESSTLYQFKAHPPRYSEPPMGLTYCVTAPSSRDTSRPVLEPAQRCFGVTASSARGCSLGTGSEGALGAAGCRQTVGAARRR